MHLRVDRSALRVNQASIVGLLVVAFLLGAAWLVAAVAIAMAIGTVWPEAGPFRLLYRRVLRPAGLVRSAIVDDDPAPHRFALGLGSACLVLALLGFLADATVVGWVLSWMVVGLAATNLATGFCLGCFLHYQLARSGLLGTARGGRPA